ncbi:MAG: serine/threonine-protein kinase [Gemmatimonadota bacterium]|jgi:serine/threonine-protein kinase
MTAPGVPGGAGSSQKPDGFWDRWDELDTLFEAVLEREPHEREGFLAEACGDDHELHATLTQLLSLEEDADTPLEGPGQELLRMALDGGRDPGSDAIAMGARIGRYRIVGRLGRGGMATVYEAERADGAFQRSVALKVLRRGLDTEDVVERFVAERQILSGLSHPHIATLLDGGATEDGRPFLAMEKVDGDPITEWADRRGSTATERVRLFLQVVDAVAFAHGQLVIHRDIKPSNVLVTEAGQVKLLDFGVAKLLDPDGSGDGAETKSSVSFLTPEFASPEQVRGGRVTTASDVFQLGALLYRLLTGAMPFPDSRGGAEPHVRAEPMRPSERLPRDDRRRSELRGDLDTILLKAMRDEPAERYPSAEALGADLRRYLEGRPISARPASAAYRLRKFTKRNPWLPPVVGTLAVVLAAYVVTLARSAGVLEAQRNAAREQAERAEALQSFLVNQFQAADPNRAISDRGRKVTLVEAMGGAVERARVELAGQPLLRAEILSTVSGVYNSLGLQDEADALVHEALDIRRRQGADDSPEQLEDLGLLALIVSARGQQDSAVALFERRLDAERARFGDHHPRVADALQKLAFHRGLQGRYEESAVMWQQAVDILRNVAPPRPTELSAALAGLSDAYRAVDRWDDAYAAASEAHALTLKELGPDHAQTAQQGVHLAQVLHGLGRLDEAEARYRAALPVLERTFGADHEITLSTWNNLANVLDQAGDFAGAEAVHRRLLASRRAQAGGQPDNAVAFSLQNLAAVVLRQGRLNEADSLAHEAETIFRRVHGDAHYSVAFSLLTQAEVRLQRGEGRAAEAVITPASAILERWFGEGFPLAAAQCRLGRAWILEGRREDGASLVRSSLEVLREHEGVPPREVASCAGALEAVQAQGG